MKLPYLENDSPISTSFAPKLTLELKEQPIRKKEKVNFKPLTQLVPFDVFSYILFVTNFLQLHMAMECRQHLNCFRICLKKIKIVDTSIIFSEIFLKILNSKILCPFGFNMKNIKSAVIKYHQLMSKIISINRKLCFDQLATASSTTPPLSLGIASNYCIQ